MGQYITNDSIYSTKLYGLTNNDVPSATMDVYIDDAEALVDGYLSKVYAVPFTSTAVPPLVVNITKDITAYYASDYLWQQGNRNVNKQNERRYERAMDLLQKIKDENLGLILSGSVVSPDTSIDQATTYGGIGIIVDLDDELNWPDGASGSLLDIIDARRDLEG